MFLRNGDRAMVKRFLQLLVEKVVINLPKVKIVVKPDGVLAVLENKTAARTDGVLTAVSGWLPSTYNRKNFCSTLFPKQNKWVRKSCGRAKT
jgi:hypothetical protein